MEAQEHLSYKTQSRKRGRPAGKNRMPLSSEQRKSRNAQYEKERRNEIAHATLHLAKAVGCDGSVTLQNLLTSVIKLLDNKANCKPSESIQILRQRNEDICKEIQEMELFLKSKGLNKQEYETDSECESYNLRSRGSKRKSENICELQYSEKKQLNEKDVKSMISTASNLVSFTI
ncbi:unnamed protein product [Parnassius apollo]|uniref:(apollo) hypothetical protein n=1 Tax=Parnassius apollo TaxID=110799 RepID=A0A8S3WCB8_PARAO|nr:unnamed protein product [Parnassius apollo]